MVHQRLPTLDTDLLLEVGHCGQHVVALHEKHRGLEGHQRGELALARQPAGGLPHREILVDHAHAEQPKDVQLCEGKITVPLSKA